MGWWWDFGKQTWSWWDGAASVPQKRSREPGGGEGDHAVPVAKQLKGSDDVAPTSFGQRMRQLEHEVVEVRREREKVKLHVDALVDELKKERALNAQLNEKLNEEKAVNAQLNKKLHEEMNSQAMLNEELDLARLEVQDLHRYRDRVMDVACEPL